MDYAQSTQGYAPSFPGSGSTTGAARDVGTFGMAANRVRAINNTLASVIERLNREGARLRGEPYGIDKASNTPTPPQASPSPSIPGLMAELEQAETLLTNVVNAAGFIERL